MSASTPLSHKDYTVGWICALSLEMAAAKLMLDTIHPPLPLPPTDQNTYILGNIRGHNIVIACLPSGAYGTTSAATVAMQLLSSFHSIRFGLMVGIGGGVPSSDADIRLGDIVVSEPTGTFGGVIQYDMGKALSGGQFQRTGMLNRPPKVLLTALATLKAHHLTEESQILTFIANIEAKAPRGAANFVRPSHADCLYQVEYEHGGSNDCSGCDRSRLVSRPSRGHDEPVIHYGLIASANQVVKYGRHRDQLAEDLGVYCVEMEAAGLMNDFPCIVIRGICDYADSHKNKDWQGYAAAVAAAYARELLLVVPINHIENTPTAQEALANAAPCFDVPFDLATVPVIQDFLGRQDELEHLWDYLQPATPQSQKVAVLHGLGGIGKTQLAIRFARDHKKDFSAVLWLSGKDEGTLLQSLSSVFPRLPGESCDNEAVNDEEVEKRARKVLKWLSAEGNSRWLIIFDNFDQYSPIDSDVDDGYDIAQFFPTADHGSILITSRLHGLTELGKSFPVHKLEFKDAIQLLLQSSGLSVDNTTEDLDSNPDYVALADCLDGLPLAIVIAGAFMRETGTSVEEYLQLYKDSWADLQSCSRPTRHYQQGNILETWMITYKEIQESEPEAAMLLLLLACYNNRDIWFELIQHGLNCTDLPDWFGMSVYSKLYFKTKIKILVGFSLVETNKKEGSYTLHPVVQDWCLYMAESDKHTAQLYGLALVSVGSMIPAPDNRDYARLQRRLLPHANHLLRTKRYWPDEGIDVWKVLANLGNLYQTLGKLKEAEWMHQQALAGFEKILGRDHASTLDTVNNLGVLYWVQGKLKEAEEMYQQVLEASEKTLGPDHTSTILAFNNLGLLYRDQGKLEEAEKMHQQALAGYTKVLGPHHPSTITIVSSLGNLYRYQGKLKDAEDTHQQALAGFKKELGPDHTSVLESIHSLGTIYMDQGMLKEAEEMFQQALAGFEKALGLDHISTLGAVNNLGLLYWAQGRLKEAEKMLQRALTGYRKALGPEHSNAQTAANYLASLATFVAKAGNTPLTPPTILPAAQVVQLVQAARELDLNRRHSSVPESPQ